MSDVTLDRTENVILGTEISDDVLEAAASAGNAGAYTQFAYCTSFACPSVPSLDSVPEAVL